LALVILTIFDFVAGPYTRATKSNLTRSTLSPNLNTFNSCDFVESGVDGQLFVRRMFDKVERVYTLATKLNSTCSTLSTVDTVERVEFDFVAIVYWAL